jgi:hypothetical protein
VRQPAQVNVTITGDYFVLHCLSLLWCSTLCPHYTPIVPRVHYSYHWTDTNNQLITRWDNTPHFPDLPGFPDHIHDGATGQVTPGQPMSIFTVLDEIAGRS